jgi:hypothetical protein
MEDAPQPAPEPVDEGPPAVGFLDLYATGSAAGRVVVPGAEVPTRLFFTLRNATSRALTVDLWVRAEGSDATVPLGLEDENGAALTRVRLEPNATQPIVVWARAPASSPVGSRVLLSLHARAAAPHPQSAMVRASLEVAGQPGGAEPQVLDLRTVTATDADDLSPGVPSTTMLDVRFASVEASATDVSVVVRARVEVSAGVVEEWPVFFGGLPRSVDGPGQVSTEVRLTAGTPRRIAVQVRPPTQRPAMQSALATMTLSVSTTTLSPPVTVTHPPLRLTLRPR